MFCDPSFSFAQISLDPGAKRAPTSEEVSNALIADSLFSALILLFNQVDLRALLPFASSFAQLAVVDWSLSEATLSGMSERIRRIKLTQFAIDCTQLTVVHPSLAPFTASRLFVDQWSSRVGAEQRAAHNVRPRHQSLCGSRAGLLSRVSLSSCGTKRRQHQAATGGSECAVSALPRFFFPSVCGGSGKRGRLGEL